MATLTEFGFGEMRAVIRARSVGKTLWTDEVRTALQLDTNCTAELVHLITRTTYLHLGTVALAFVPAP